MDLVSVVDLGGRSSFAEWEYFRIFRCGGIKTYN